MVNCKKCKKEIENKDVVEMFFYDKVVWGVGEELIKEGFGITISYFHKDCIPKELLIKG